jgi:hypothetical protein
MKSIWFTALNLCILEYLRLTTVFDCGEIGYLSLTTLFDCSEIGYLSLTTLFDCGENGYFRHLFYTVLNVLPAKYRSIIVITQSKRYVFLGLELVCF